MSKCYGTLSCIRPKEPPTRSAAKEIIAAEWVLRRKPKKRLDRVAARLQQRLGVAMLVDVRQHWWIIDEGEERKEGAEDRRASGRQDSGPDARLHHQTGEAGPLPEAPVSGWPTTLVTATGLPLVAPMGDQVRTVIAHGWPYWNAADGFSDQMDTVYADRKPTKALTKNLERHAKKERDYAKEP